MVLGFLLVRCHLGEQPAQPPVPGLVVGALVP
jgi:hypothetical protein